MNRLPTECKKAKKIFTKKNFVYLQCNHTKTIFAIPRPKPELLEKFYLNTNSEYLGPLKDPKKNIKFIFNYFFCKIYYLYVRLLYNKLYSKN